MLSGKISPRKFHPYACGIRNYPIRYRKLAFSILCITTNSPASTLTDCLYMKFFFAISAYVKPTSLPASGFAIRTTRLNPLLFAS